jgi:hypothetical protein
VAIGLSTYTVILAPVVAGVIVALVADVAWGARNLPHAALFRTAEIVLLAAYLIIALAVYRPSGLLVLWLPLVILLPAGYLALGAVQATAIAMGLEQWGIRSRWRARLGGLLLAFVPVLGSALAVWGAGLGWHWSTGTGAMRFFGPFAAIVAPPVAFFGRLSLVEAGILT